MYVDYLLVVGLFIAFVVIVNRYFEKYRMFIFTVIFPAILFIGLSEEMLRRKLSFFDSSVYNYIVNYMSPNMTSFMKFLSFLGSSSVLIVAAVALYYTFGIQKKKYIYGKVIILNLAITALLNNVFKLLFHRQRPDVLRLVSAGGYSFPSGHSMTSLSFYGLLMYFSYIGIKNIWTKFFLLIAFSLLILLIGISRIYLGVHYASDVLAGFFAGFIWLSIYIPAVKKYMESYRQEQEK